VIRSSHHTLIGGSWAVRQLTLEFGQPIAPGKIEVDEAKMIFD
jgi:hypothetical protein